MDHSSSKILEHRLAFITGLLGFFVGSWLLVPFLGQDFFPNLDAGSFRLHVLVPTGLMKPIERFDPQKGTKRLRDMVAFGKYLDPLEAELFAADQAPNSELVYLHKPAYTRANKLLTFINS